MTIPTVRSLVARVPEGAILWGVGNYAGTGARFMTLLQQDSPC
jgi:hypothetical protein